MDQDADALPRNDILDLTTKFNQLIAMRAVANGVCDLDGSGLVPNARLAAKLAALAALGTTLGLVEQTGPDAFAKRAISANIKSFLDAADNLAARTALGSAALASPTFTGTPAAPTAAATTNTTQLASTAFVQQELGALNVNSMTLLGTLLTTSGATQTLSGLNLTNYKLVLCSIERVSNTAAGCNLQLAGSDLVDGAANTAAHVNGGLVWVELSTGIVTANMRSTLDGIGQPGSVYLFDSPYSTATTSIVFSWNAGNFDAGQIRIWGVK